MIQQIIDEVRNAINDGYYLVALMGALTLPDICGKNEYQAMRTGERYKKWCDTYVYPIRTETAQMDEHHDCGITSVNGKIIYSLRCSLLHQGSSNIDSDECEVEDFELLIQSKNEFDIYVDNFGVV